MTHDELLLIKRALLPYEFSAYSHEEWRDMKIKANQLINRELNLKVMDVRLSKEADSNIDSNMKMYGE